MLTEEEEAGIPQWRCQIGHRYSAESLAEIQATSIEAALWTAIRALGERAALLERLADQCAERDQPKSARRFRGRAGQAREQADQVRDALKQAGAAALRGLEEPDARVVEPEPTT